MYGNRPFRAAPPPPSVEYHEYNPPDISQLFSSVQQYSATWVWIDIETSGLQPEAPDFGILEISAVVTSHDLVVQDTLHIIVHQTERVLSHASKWCKAHFASRVEGGNDLFDQCRASVITEERAGELLKDFILRHSAPRRRAPQINGDPRRELFKAAEFGDVVQAAVEGGGEAGAVPVPPPSVAPAQPSPPRDPQHDVYRVMLAGCSVYFDRMVLLARFPYLHSHIGHKVIDMTSILEIARRYRPDLLCTLRPPTCTHRAMQDIMESMNILRWFYINCLAPSCPTTTRC